MYPHKTSPPSDDDSAYSSMMDDSEHGARSMAMGARTSQSPIASPNPSFAATSSSSSSTTFGHVLTSNMPLQPTLFAASQSNHFIASPLVGSDVNKAGAPSYARDPSHYVKTILDQSIGFPGSNLQIRVLGVPLQKAKSRVETQIKLCLQLVTMKGEKVPHWSYLRLPELLTTRDRQRRGKNSDSDFASLPPEDVLDLQATVVCASDPSKAVSTCSGCIQRELKRMRKKDAGTRQRLNADGELMFEPETEEETMEQERKKILLFNCASFVDFSSGDTILPTRITCYCRHHNEKLGFCIYFIARDSKGNIISTGISPPILITDDHKSSKTKGQKRPRSDDFDDVQPTGIDSTIPTEITQSFEPMSLVSPGLQSPPFVKEESLSATGTPFLPADGSGGNFLTPIGSSLFPQMDLSMSDSDAFLNLSPPPAKRQYVGAPEEEDFTVSLTETLLASLENAALQHPVPSAHPTPTIGRIIPAEGPMHGGIEITVLGSGFYDGLTVLFGDVPAGKIQLWGSSTIICILPPSAIPGPVPITFKEHPAMAFMPVNEISIFTYKDESERALMELALQVVGLRMTGKLEDARNVAMRIVTDTAKEGGGGGGEGDAGGRRRNVSSFAVGHSISRLLVELSGRRRPCSRSDLELCLLDALISIESLEDSDDMFFRDVINLRSKITKHSLLHLACFAGMTTIAKYLVSSGADIDARDSNGFTPLHYAVWSGERSLAMELLEAGASPFLTSMQGMSALGIAKKAGYPAIYDAIREFVVDPVVDADTEEEEEEEEDEEEFSEDEDLEEVVFDGAEEDAGTERASLRSSILSVSTSDDVAEAEIYAAPVATPAPVSDEVVATPPPLDEKAALVIKDANDQLETMKTLIAEAAAALPEKLPTEKGLPAIPPLTSEKLKDGITPSSLAWLTFPTFTAPQFAPLIALPVQLPTLPSMPQLPKIAMPNIGMYLPIEYFTGPWFGADPVAAAVAAAQQHVLAGKGDKGIPTPVSDPSTLDPPPPYSPPAQSTPPRSQPTAVLHPTSSIDPPLQETTTPPPHRHESFPTQSMPRQRVPAHFSSQSVQSSPNSFPLPSIVPPPPSPIDPTPLDLDSMDDLCDCGAASFATPGSRDAVHEPDCRRTVALDALGLGNVGVVALTGAEYLRKSIDKALLLFWIPMMLGVLCLAMFRLVATNEDMDNLVAKFVTMHTAFLHNVGELLQALKNHLEGGGGLFYDLWHAAQER
ncbi:SPT3 Dosage dependent suppressor of Ty-induced promoter mutations-like protein [Dinochytrium kinnereticum]|nr:SPT3 Dosage dependent suppressor of Ty-induced promoter mutations-like protein [Dinochytrium kinnereticum]